MRTGSSQDVQNKLREMGKQVLSGKGGFWIKDQGFVSLAKARKMTGISAPKREAREKVGPFGDWATIYYVNGGK